MIVYFLRRLLLALPTLLVISLATFALSHFTASEPVKANYWESPVAYLNEVEKLGLDQPLFYCALGSAAFPDTLHRVFPLEDRERLERLTRQSGNWAATVHFWKAITSDLGADVEHLSGPVLIGFAALRQIPELEQVPPALNRLQQQVDTIPDAALKTRLQARLARIGAAFDEIRQDPQLWKLYVPAPHWYGSQNQYHRWISAFLSGNPGNSVVTGNSLLTELRPRLLVTLLLNGVAMLLSYLLGVPLGVLMAQRYPGRFERSARASLLFLYAMPVIWLGSLLIMLLSRPGIGLELFDGMNAEPWLMNGTTFGEWFGKNWIKFVLPVLTLTLHSMAILALQMRGGILEVVRQDFIRTARAKGLSEHAVFWRHAFRNALFPVISVFAHFFPAIFSGSLVVEALFDFPGMGSKLYAAYSNNDYAVLFAIVMFVAALTILGSVVADLLYAWADPRVRFAKR